jgi:hypothetical protein
MFRNTKFKSHIAAPVTALRQLLCAAAVSAMAIVPAHADIIDFEGYFGPAAHGDFIQTNGYNVRFFSNTPGAVFGESLVGSFLDGTDSQSCDVSTTRCPVNNPGIYYGALNDGYVDVTSNSAANRFSINGFDLSYIGSNPSLSSYPAIPGFVRVQGFFANGTSQFEDYLLSAPTAAGFNFNRFNTSAAFSANAFVEAAIFGFTCNTAGSCNAFTTNRGQFGIDNISLNAVPEPASFALFGIGMIGMGAVARRRRNSL